jgi:hypothetical protein
MPGIYDLSSEALHMKEYVDVEGSGINGTVVKGNPSQFGAVIHGASFAEIRNLRVEHNSGYGIYNLNTSPHITNVNVITDGTTAMTATSIFNQNASPIVNNVSIKNFGYTQNYNYESAAIVAYSGSPVFKNITIDHSVNSIGGMAFICSDNPSVTIDNMVINSNNNTSTMQFQYSNAVISNSVITNSSSIPIWLAYNVNITISNSTISANTPSNLALGGGGGTPPGTAYIRNSEVNGVVAAHAKCINSFDKNLTPITCQ